MPRWSTFLAGVVLASGLSLAAAPQRGPIAGVVVDGVGVGGVAQKAGLRPADVLISWKRPGQGAQGTSEGELGTPFDLVLVELEQAPLGTIHLSGRRDGRPFALQLTGEDWRVDLRPVLAGVLLVRYESGRRLLEAGRPKDAAEAWRAVAADLASSGQHHEASWLDLKAAKIAAAAKLRGESTEAFRSALEQARLTRQPCIAAIVWQAQGEAWYRQFTDYDQATLAYREAIALREPAGGLALAESLVELGRALHARRDEAGAEQSSQRAASILEAAAPQSLSLAKASNAIAAVAFSRGDLDSAELLWKRALPLMEKAAPESRDLAVVLGNLGLACSARGDLVQAEAYQRRALQRHEALSPRSTDVAVVLNYLGALARRRGDYATAESRLGQAADILERLEPEGVRIATCWKQLGNLAHAREDWAAAEVHFTKTLQAWERLGPQSLDHAASLQNLGEVALRRGSPARAEDLFVRALDIKHRLAAGTLIEASAVLSLAEVARHRGDLEKALRLGREALAIVSKEAPGTSREAEALYELGRVQRMGGRAADAITTIARAVDALEAQRGRLGGADEGFSAFTAKYSGYYRDLAEMLVDRGRAEDAFHVLERNRARSLLAMLSERDLTFAGELPPELVREQRKVEAEYDRTQAQFARLGSSGNEADTRTLTSRLLELRDRRLEIDQRLRAASPRVAALREPQPLSLAQARASLDPGTLLLAYSVGKERTLLFAVRGSEGAPPGTGGGVSVFTLPIGQEALAERIAAFRSFLRRGREIADVEPALVAQGARLFSLLLEPVQELIGQSRRVLLCPDGALHELPFAALVRTRQPLEYMAEWKPLHTVVSATLYAELQKRRGAPAPARDPILVAFGDPSYPQEADAVKAFGLASLPWARSEVRQIAALYPPGASISYVGADATEERARALGTGPRHLHFASHAVLDDRFPLDSALALAIPAAPRDGQHNGLLQAWEIFEGMRIDADLVTLSACASASGLERGGEGLVGLARAFQFAGAHSVLASLWPVSDRSTADFMRRFYAALREGQSKDEALQTAQRGLIAAPSGPRAPSAPDPRHPFCWAAFQLIGDWR